MRNNISHFQEGKQPLQYLSINLCPGERDLCYWHRVNGKIPPRILPFHELMFLTFCAYELVANSSKKLLYNTRPYWCYGIVVPLNIGIIQRRAPYWRDCSVFPILYCLLYTPALFWLYEALYILVDAFCDLKVRLAIGGRNKSCAAIYQYQYNCVCHNFQEIGHNETSCLSILLVVSLAEQGTNLVLRDEFGGPVRRQPVHSPQHPG